MDTRAARHFTSLRGTIFPVPWTTSAQLPPEMLQHHASQIANEENGLIRHSSRPSRLSESTRYSLMKRYSEQMKYTALFLLVCSVAGATLAFSPPTRTNVVVAVGHQPPKRWHGIAVPSNHPLVAIPKRGFSPSLRPSTWLSTTTSSSNTVFDDHGDHEMSSQSGKDDKLLPKENGAITTYTTAEELPSPQDQRYSASDWLHNIKSLNRSSILQETKGPVLAVMGWSALLSCIHQGLLWKGFTAAAKRMCISSKPHSFLVSALGLLLVFRTNSAYQRFAEGRVIWERILSISRNMSRMAILYDDEFGVKRSRRFFRLLAAFPYLLHHHIHPSSDASRDKEYGLALIRSEPVQISRAGSSSSSTMRKNQPHHHPSLQQQQQKRISKNGDYTKNNANNNNNNNSSNDDDDDDGSMCWVDRRNLPWSLFPDTALQLCAQSSNRPLWVCDRLSEEVNNIEYTPNFTSRERLTFLSQIGHLSKCVGECERIHQTAVPLNYARHSLRSLTLWLFTLPFALLEDFGWMTGPVMGLTAWMFYGVYQIGYTIEDPFVKSLRLSNLCDAIFRDVMTGTDAMQQRMTAFEPSAQEQEEWGDLDETTMSRGSLFPQRATNFSSSSSMPRP